MSIDRDAKACEGHLTEWTWGDAGFCGHCGAAIVYKFGDKTKSDWKDLCQMAAVEGKQP